MKKALSLLLAVVLILSTFAVSFAVFAEDVGMKECTCSNCTRVPNGCHCCAYCPYIDKTFLLSCAKDEDGNFKGSFCCGECSGIWPCDCHCGCEACENKSQEPDPDPEPIIPEAQRKTFIEAFQSAIKRVAAVFDKIFNAIFEFLRIDELVKK